MGHDGTRRFRCNRDCTESVLVAKGGSHTFAVWRSSRVNYWPDRIRLSPQEKCARYWPADGSLSSGEYVVELRRDVQYEAFSLRDLLLTYAPVSSPSPPGPKVSWVNVNADVNVSSFQDKQSRLVRHFHFHGWPEVGIPPDGRGMIDLISAVQRQQQQSGNHPIVVHCRSSHEHSHTV